MFEWLAKLFRRERKPISPDQVLHSDPNAREVIARAANTGNPVCGWVDENGGFHIQELGEDNETGS